MAAIAMTTTRAAMGAVRRRTARRTLRCRAAARPEKPKPPPVKPSSLVAKAVEWRVSPEAAVAVLSALNERERERETTAEAVRQVLTSSAKLEAARSAPLIGLDLLFLASVNGAIAQLRMSGAEGAGATVAAVLLSLGQFNFQFGAFQGVGRLMLNLGTSALWANNPEQFVEALQARALEANEAEPEKPAAVGRAGPTAETLVAATEAVFALRAALVAAAGDVAGAAERGSLHRLRLYETLTGIDREAFGLSASGASDVAAAFMGLDRDGNGFVDRREWELAVEAQPMPPSREVSSAAFGMLDANDDGRLTIDEFAALWTLATPMRAPA